jgi:predicted DNA binding CopG/RHH family protein
MAGIAVPKFANESEEAQWWFEHQDVLLEEFKKAAAEGRLGRGTAMRRAMEASSIQLDVDDASKARAVAARKGISYQAYVKSLIHEALEKESAA